MKLNKKCKIESIASKDATRLVLTAPYLEVKDGKGNIIATNGKGLVVIPVEVSESDVSGHIPLTALKESRKGKVTEPILECSEKAVLLQDGTSFQRDYIGNFPIWRDVMPDPDRKTLKIALNAEMLHSIASAMGTSGVVLEFDADNFSFASVKVTPASTGNEHPACLDAFGVIMPIRIS